MCDWLCRGKTEDAKSNTALREQGRHPLAERRKKSCSHSVEAKLADFGNRVDTKLQQEQAQALARQQQEQALKQQQEQAKTKEPEIEREHSRGFGIGR